MVDLSSIDPSKLWYVVGLIATDGNLSSDSRHISITSKDEAILRDIRKAFRLENKIGLKANGSSKAKVYSVLQIGSDAFYQFLLGIGLTPKKSLTIGVLNIPDNFSQDFLRGIIDGDGSISSWSHHSNGNMQWSLRLVSGSAKFLRWLNRGIFTNFKLHGKFYTQLRSGSNPLYVLKYGKFAAKMILRDCYYQGCMTIPRKLQNAEECIKSGNGLRTYGKLVAT